MTLRDAYIAGARRLAEDPHLRQDASRDAATLVLSALGLTHTALHTDPTRILSEAENTTIQILLDRRLRFEPIQYILGEQEFYGLPFHVTPATLIPRPETELLVEAMLDRLPRDRPLRIADVGTGSGAIAIAIAHHVPRARLFALDVSPDALTVAQKNARRNDLAERIDFRLSDLLKSAGPGPFDAIVSNPPYVPEADRPTLHPQVRDHEPSQALFAGPDGLAVYRRLIPQAWRALIPGGLLAMEFGYGQAAALTHLLADWHEVEILDDLNAIPRVALARMPL